MATTGHPKTHPSAPTAAPPIADWVMHFTTPGNVADRGFYEREGDVPHPGDGKPSETEWDQCLELVSVVRGTRKAISNGAGYPEIKSEPSEPRSTFPLVVEGPITPMLGFLIDNDFAKSIERCGQQERYHLLAKMPQIAGFQRGLSIHRLAASELSSRLKLKITVACDAFQN